MQNVLINLNWKQCLIVFLFIYLSAMSNGNNIKICKFVFKKSLDNWNDMKFKEIFSMNFKQIDYIYTPLFMLVITSDVSVKVVKNRIKQ